MNADPSAMPVPLAIPCSSLGILVVDDRYSTRDIIRYMLEDAGFDAVDEASEGRAALEMASSKRYALMICDWDMATVSGLDVLRAVRADPTLQALGFIMASARAGAADLAKAKAAGAQGFIVKPFCQCELLHAVASGLDYAAARATVGASSHRAGRTVSVDDAFQTAA